MTNSENQTPSRPQNFNLPLIALILAFVFPVAGIIVSVLARKEVRQSQGDKQSSDRAQLALILSIVFFVIQVIVIAFWITAYIEAVNSMNQYQSDLNNYIDDLNNQPEVCYDPYLDEYTVEACY